MPVHVTFSGYIPYLSPWASFARGTYDGFPRHHQPGSERLSERYHDQQRKSQTDESPRVLLSLHAVLWRTMQQVHPFLACRRGRCWVSCRRIPLLLRCSFSSVTEAIQQLKARRVERLFCQDSLGLADIIFVGLQYPKLWQNGNQQVDNQRDRGAQLQTANPWDLWYQYMRELDFLKDNSNEKRLQHYWKDIQTNYSTALINHFLAGRDAVIEKSVEDGPWIGLNVLQYLPYQIHAILS